MQEIERSIEITPALTQQQEQRLAMAKLLTRLAIARQTTLSGEFMKVYLASLGGFDLRDIEAAVGRLSIERRREFAPAFPDLGELVECVTDAASARKAASKGKFQSCGLCYNGLMLVMVPGLDGRTVRAYQDCQCLMAWRAARKMSVV